MWTASIQLNTNTSKILMTVIYHPPNKEECKFLQWLENDLDEIQDFEGENITAGDFNFDWNIQKYCIKKCKDIIYKNSFTN